MEPISLKIDSGINRRREEKKSLQDQQGKMPKNYSWLVLIRWHFPPIPVEMLNLHQIAELEPLHCQHLRLDPKAQHLPWNIQQRVELLRCIDQWLTRNYRYWVWLFGRGRTARVHGGRSTDSQPENQQRTPQTLIDWLFILTPSFL